MDAFSLLQRALRCSYDKKGDEDAIIFCTEAISIDPNYDKAYDHRSLRHSRLGNNDLAVADVEVALKIKPNDNNYRSNLETRLSTKLREEEKAKEAKLREEKRAIYKKTIEEQTELIKRNPNDAIVYFNRGNTLKENGETLSAIEDFKNAVKFSPNNNEYIKALENLENEEQLNKQRIATITSKNKRNKIIRIIIGIILGGFSGIILVSMVSSNNLFNIIAGLIIGAVVGVFICNLAAGDGGGFLYGGLRGVQLGAIIYAVALAIIALIFGKSFFSGILYGAIAGAICNAIIGALGGLFKNYD